MKLNIITNIDNGKGLQRDYWLLREWLQERGHQVVGLQYDRDMHQRHAPKADVNIFCETLVNDFFPAAGKNVVFVNPEWWHKHFDEYVDNLDLILCKTRHAESLFADTGKALYTGFIADDRLDKDIPRKQRFLHVCGGSRAKNTKPILEAWHEYGIPADLVVIGQHFEMASRARGVTWYPYVSQSQLRRLQNECLYHLCTSCYEGFGHYIHEGMSAGNLLLVTDAPPMNEVPTLKALKIPVHHQTPLRKAMMSEVTPEAVKDAVLQALELHPTAVRTTGGKIRKQFERGQEEFEESMSKVLA